ncbi:hypothetical protein CERZMDRAFT_99954 [Cercospora zeae-maydis SCOH1-5]|uniref:Apple domain-containing protein n=1 Tax=Cercospora zeae-maydis SCOH1-5 TaxID=717836 RepID=A0A6A6F927_9PEZI|nr:hypothetical protein CERZMDRAFT_99954 [Cercospora zeae-maydis SCOH1-5]
MYSQLLVVALIPASVATAIVSSNPICKKFPYSALQPLSKISAVQSFCTSKFPAAPCTSTSTTAITATAFTTVSTSTITTGTTTEITTVQTDTNTVTTSTSTVTDFTGTTTETTFTSRRTSTTFTSTATFCSRNDKRDAPNIAFINDHVQLHQIIPRPSSSKLRGRYARVDRREPARSPAYPTPDALKKLAASVVKTLCSCATKAALCVTGTTTATSTTTSSVTATISTLATSTSSVTVTVTRAVDMTITISKLATTTISAVTTTTVSRATTTEIPCLSCESSTKCINQPYARFCGYRLDKIEGNALLVVTVTSVDACEQACMLTGQCETYVVNLSTGLCTAYGSGVIFAPSSDELSAFGRIGQCSKAFLLRDGEEEVFSSIFNFPHPPSRDTTESPFGKIPESMELEFDFNASTLFPAFFGSEMRPLADVLVSSSEPGSTPAPDLDMYGVPNDVERLSDILLKPSDHADVSQDAASTMAISANLEQTFGHGNVMKNVKDFAVP